MSIAVKYRDPIAVKPQRIPEPELRGRNWRKPQTYVIGWPDGIVKVGCTSLGRERWGRFLARGGSMLDLSFYVGADAVDAESWLEDRLSEKYQPAFRSKEESKPYLGSSGSGYMECYRVPVSDWPALIELARS